MRQRMFDSLLEFIQRYLCANLVEALNRNKRKFSETFLHGKNAPQFEISVWFDPNNGKLGTDPSFEEHYTSFLSIFENMDKVVYNNQNLIDFVYQLQGLFYRPRRWNHKTIFYRYALYLYNFRSITNYRENVFENLKRDIADSREFVAQFTQTQEIYDFVQDWKR